MKRILLTLFLILLVLTTVSAEERSNYNFGDYFSITFPDDWKLNDILTSPPLINVQSPNKHPSIIVTVSPIVSTSIDDRITDIQSSLTKHKFYVFEDQGKLETNARETRWLLYSIENSDQPKTYWLFYTAYGTQYRYQALILGFYKDLEIDRKAVNDIISSIKIL